MRVKSKQGIAPSGGSTCVLRLPAVQVIAAFVLCVLLVFVCLQVRVRRIEKVPERKSQTSMRDGSGPDFKKDQEATLTTPISGLR